MTMDSGSPPQTRPGTKAATGLEVDDIQAIVVSGFPRLARCRYLLLQITDPARARAWLRHLLDSGAVLSAGDHLRGLSPRNDGGSVACIATVAFTFRGLRALGVQEDPRQPFPSGFAGGMTDRHRSRLLGDDNLDEWGWVDAAGDDEDAQTPDRLVHILVGLFSDDVNPASIPAPSVAAYGLSIVREVKTCPRYLKVDPSGRQATMSEPFGFRDAISQPRIEGLRDAPASSRADDHLVKPGEFILGYPNEYGELAYCPDVTAPRSGPADGAAPFGRNGTYLVARQIWQDVPAFRRFEQATAATLGATGPTAAEKMMGRYKSGEPLVQSPFAPGNLNDFRYRQADFDGFQCPRGAHVRRANPRDLLGWDTPSGIAASKLHRLLRRGRVYARSDCQECAGRLLGKVSAPNAMHETRAGASQATQACGEGLVFLALNADLERQFEIVQSRWLANRQFNDLEGDDDLATPTGKDRRFSMQGPPAGTVLGKEVGLGDFTRVIGGGYFFLPGLTALRRLARGGDSPASGSGSASSRVPGSEPDDARAAG